MLPTSEILRLLRQNNYSIEDIKLCYNTAISLGYKDQDLIDIIKTMLTLIKQETTPSSSNMKNKLLTRKTLLEIQKIRNLFLG